MSEGAIIPYNMAFNLRLSFWALKASWKLFVPTGWQSDLQRIYLVLSCSVPLSDTETGWVLSQAIEDGKKNPNVTDTSNLHLWETRL